MYTYISSVCTAFLKSAKMSGLLGIATGVVNAGINYGSQIGLMNHQANNQMDINNHNQELNKEMWDYTNYENQMKHMKNAGLNPALMYGKGGSGGTTGNSGGSASGGNGVQMDIASNMANMANVELQNAQAEKLRVETEKLRTVDTDNVNSDTEKKKAEALSITQGIENQKAQKELINVQSRLGEIGIKKAIAEVEAIGYENKINKEVVDEKIKIIENEAIGGELRNILTKVQTTNTKQMTEESKSRINKMVEDIAQGWKGLELNEKQRKIEEFKADLTAEYPSAWELIGKMGNDLMRSIEGKDESDGRKVKDK